MGNGVRRIMDRSQVGSNIASLAGYTLEDAIEKIQLMGFKTIELLAFAGARHSIGDLPGFWFDELTETQREALRTSLDAFDHISLHAPFSDAPLFTYNPGIQATAIAQVRETIEAAWHLGAEVVTVHINPRPLFKLEEYWSDMVALFNNLGGFAAACDVKIGIETGFPNTVKDFTNLFLDIDHDSVGATVDVGHIVPYIPRDTLESEQGVQIYNDTLMQLVTLLGSKIHHFHLHDVRQADWRDHRTAGSGIIDYNRLFTFLADISYEGAFTFELEETDIELALEASKQFVYALMDRYGNG